MEKEKRRFSFRKAHFGLASALLGTTLILGAGNTAVVEADEQTGISDADALQSADALAPVETTHLDLEANQSPQLSDTSVKLDEFKPTLPTAEIAQEVTTPTEATPVTTEVPTQATNVEKPQPASLPVQSTTSQINVVSTETLNPGTTPAKTAVDTGPEGVSGPVEVKGSTLSTSPDVKLAQRSSVQNSEVPVNRIIGKGSSIADVEKVAASQSVNLPNPSNPNVKGFKPAEQSAQDLKPAVDQATQAVAQAENQVKVADSIVAEATDEVNKAETAVIDNNKAIVAADQLVAEAQKIKETATPAQVQAWETFVQTKDSEAKELQSHIDKANRDINSATNVLNSLKNENVTNLNPNETFNKSKLEAELAEAERMYNLNVKNQDEIELALSNLRKDIASKEAELARLQADIQKYDQEKLDRIEQLKSEINAIQQKQLENIRQREAIEKNALSLDVVPNYTSGMTKQEFGLSADKGISFTRTNKQGIMLKVDYKSALAKAVAGDATELQNLVNLREASAFSMSMKNLNIYNMPTDTDSRVLNVDNLSLEDLQELNLYIAANINKLRAELGLMPFSISKQGIQKADQFKNTIYTATVQPGSPVSDSNPPRWGNVGENYHHMNRRVWGDNVDLAVVTGDSGYRPAIYSDTNYAVNELNSRQATMGELKNKLLKSLLNVLTEDVRSMKHSNNFGGAQMLLNDSTNSHIAVAVPRLAGTAKAWSDMNSVVFVTYRPESTEDELANPFQTGGVAKSEFAKKISDLQRQYDDQYKEFIVRDRERLALQDSLVGDTKGISDLQDALQFGKKNEATLEHRLENTKGLLVTYQKEIDRIKTELGAQKAKSGEEQSKADDYQTKVDALNQQLREAKAAKASAENRLEAIKKERDTLIRNIDLAKNADARMAEARKVVADRSAQVATLADQLEKAKANLASAKVEQVSAQGALTKAKADLQTAKSAYDKALGREADEKAKRDAEQAKKDEESRKVAEQLRKEQEENAKKHNQAVENSNKFYAQAGTNPMGVHAQTGADATYQGKTLGHSYQAGSTLPATGSNDSSAIGLIGATMAIMGATTVSKRRRQDSEG